MWWGSLPLHFLVPFADEEANFRLTSGLVSFIISYILEDRTSLEYYLGFLLFDCIKPRKQGLTRELLFHHGLAASLVLITLNKHMIFDPSDFYVVNFITRSFLVFERTTPFLHLSWILRHFHYTNAATIVFVCVILAWIPWRLQPSYDIYMVSHLIPNYASYVIVMVLCALQWYWFYKLCITFAGAIMPICHETNGGSPKKNEAH